MSRIHAGHGAVWALLRRWLGGVALFGLLTQATAGAAVLAEPDASAVRNVIESQLEAFAADDSERAYAHASTGIRARFGDAATFMAMVRAGYPMLIRPAAVSFFRAQTQHESDPPSPAAQQAVQVVQVVQVRDREGRLWRATYLLERQADAGWRISGCVVAADSETSGRSI
jgi:hypothetical protein